MTKRRLPGLPAFFAAAAFAATLSQSLGSSGRLVLTHPPDRNWGTRLQGDRIRLPFTITNPGSGPCRILKVIPSCSCARTEGLFGTIEPGERVSAVLHVDTAGYVGPLRTGLILVHDGENGPRLTIECFGTVKNGFTVDPPRWSFGTRPVEEASDAPSTTVVLRSDAGFDLSSVRFEDPLGLFDLAWRESTPEKRTAELRLRRPWVVGPVITRVRFRAGGIVKEFPVDGHLRGPFEAPTAINLRLKSRQQNSRVVRIRGLRGTLESIRVQARPRSVHAEITDLDPSGCALKLRADDNVTGSGRAVVVLRARHRPDGAPADAAPETYRLLVPVRWTSFRAYVDH